MKRFLLCALLVLNAGWAHAGPYGDVLVTCFSESTTGRDRTDLARWFFIAMGQHPAIKDMSSITPEAQDSTNRRIGALYTRLITENCPSQTAMAVQKEGSASLVAAYGALGKLAQALVHGAKLLQVDGSFDYNDYSYWYDHAYTTGYFSNLFVDDNGRPAALRPGPGGRGLWRRPQDAAETETE